MTDVSLKVAAFANPSLHARGRNFQYVAGRKILSDIENRFQLPGHPSAFVNCHPASRIRPGAVDAEPDDRAPAVTRRLQLDELEPEPVEDRLDRLLQRLIHLLNSMPNALDSAGSSNKKVG